MKKLSFGFCLPLVLFVMLSVAGAAENKNQSYRIATVPWAGWSPMHVAQTKGFWKDLGLNVEVVNYDNPAVIVEAIKAGRIDFTFEMSGTMLGRYLEGENVLLIAETNWSHGGDKIIVKKGQSLEKLKGQTIGVFIKLPSCLYFLESYLHSQNLDLADFRIVELKPDDLSEQFIAGRLPVILNYDPHTIKAIEKGKGKVLASSADFEAVIPEGIWTYRKHLNSLPEKDVVNLLRGWIRAVLWVADTKNWSEYKQILNKRVYEGFPSYTEQRLRELMNNVIIHQPDRMFARNCKEGGAKNYFGKLHAFLKDNGMLKRDFAANDVFEGKYVCEALSIEKKKVKK